MTNGYFEQRKRRRKLPDLPRFKNRPLENDENLKEHKRRALDEQKLKRRNNG